MTHVSGVVRQKVGRKQEVAIFRQTSENVQQRSLWVLNILILPLNSPKIEPFGAFVPNFALLDKKILDNFADSSTFIR